MIREQDALLLPCPLLTIKDVTFDDGYCEGSICPQWVRSKVNALSEPAWGDCYWHERVRRHEEMKRKREESA